MSDLVGNKNVGFLITRLKLNHPNVTYICSVDSRRPPEGEASVGDLVKTGALGVGQFLVLHRLFKTTGFLPVIYDSQLYCIDPILNQISLGKQCRPRSDCCYSSTVCKSRDKVHI